MNYKKYVIFILLCLSILVLNASGDVFFVMPVDIDPPIVVDGKIDDWFNVPNQIEINKEEHISYGKEEWKSKEDLSGVIKLAYRANGIYIYADVIDDNVLQPYSSVNIWRGDHVELLLDSIPLLDTSRVKVGAGQYHIGLSPGDLAGANAEIYIWHPQGQMPSSEWKIKSTKTSQGYLIEAFIPLKDLGLNDIRQGMDISLDIGISDSDCIPVEQQTIASFSAKKWNTVSRDRLIPIVFGDGNGKGQMASRCLRLSNNAELPAKKSILLEFEKPEIESDKRLILFFKSRIHYERVAGLRGVAMTAEINGSRIKGENLTNRPSRSIMRDGREILFVTPNGGIAVPFAPNYSAFDSDPLYALIDGEKACEFGFDITSYVKEGKNNLELINLLKEEDAADLTIHLADVELRTAVINKEAAFEPAPTGELEVYETENISNRTYKELAEKACYISFTAGRQQYEVKSYFTAPDGKKYPGSNEFYEHARTIEKFNEWIIVKDTFKNLTNDKIPIIQNHSCNVIDVKPEKVYISCLEMSTGKGSMNAPSNPSVYFSAGGSGAGLLALNDEFRIHSISSAEGEHVSLRDSSYVLGPGKTYTSEVAIIPTNKANVWSFVNAGRRLVNANFKLESCFGFLHHTEPVEIWSDEMLKNFITNKSINFAIQNTWKFAGNVGQPHGAEILLVRDKWDTFRKFGHRIEKLFPDGSVRHGIYYHCYLDSTKENITEHANCRVLDTEGNHLNYGGELVSKNLYFPTLENSWGKTQEKVIDAILNDIGVTALYWDEFNCSRFEYASNQWDGCSGDIDPEKYTLIRTKGSVHLLSRDWLVSQVNKIRQKKVPLVINGVAYTRTIANLQIQGFAETGSITNCHYNLLSSPVALGDHLSESSEKHTYQSMLRALDWGCVYSWYNPIIATHKTLTEHMFPITPIELHSGYIIGKERILTKKSGFFGWGDNSEFDAYVYDRDGKLTDSVKVENVRKNNKNYASIRIPQGFSVAIVRK